MEESRRWINKWIEDSRFRTDRGDGVQKNEELIVIDSKVLLLLKSWCWSWYQDFHITKALVPSHQLSFIWPISAWNSGTFIQEKWWTLSIASLDKQLRWRSNANGNQGAMTIRKDNPYGSTRNALCKKSVNFRSFPMGYQPISLFLAIFDPPATRDSAAVIVGRQVT